MEADEVSRLSFQIEGRHAIPVRAIPYVTGWKLSPDELARQLARRAGEHFSRLENVSAYHMQSGSLVKILPKEWDAYVVKLDALDADLRAKNANASQGYAAWRSESVALLPASVFVWADEFEASFYEDFSPDRISILNERPGDRDLLYTPILSDDIRSMIFSGLSARVACLNDAVTDSQDADIKLVSKAPPPISPTRTSGGDYYRRSATTAKAPDWNFWRAMRKTDEQQACALSLNIDPDSGPSFPTKELREKFDKRHRLLRANRYDRKIFTLPMAKHSGLDAGEIYLSEFAAWGLSLGWGDMPQELATMAQGRAVIMPEVAPTAETPPQSATHERFVRLRLNELWSEGELQSIMCGDARRLFGSGHAASDSERKDALNAIVDGVTVESLLVTAWRQVESMESFAAPDEVRYFKPDQAIAWVNRGRFPKFPFTAAPEIPQTAAQPVLSPQPAPASEPGTPAAEPAAKGVTTAQIAEAFDSLVTFGLSKAMTDRAAWTSDARITSGTRGGKHKSLWNPVIMATALQERNNVPMPKLNQAFNTCKFLADWREEWNRFSKM